MDLSEMPLEAVLRSYSSVKGHRTRCENEIENLLGLLTTRYSSVAEDRIKDRLEALEKHTLRLSDIKDYLIHLKYACLLYTSPSPRDATLSRMPSSA